MIGASSARNWMNPGKSRFGLEHIVRAALAL